MTAFTLHYATMFRPQRRLFLLLTPPDSVKLGFCYRRSRCRERSTPVCSHAFTFTTWFYFSTRIIERYEGLKILVQTPWYSRMAVLLVLNCLLLRFIHLIAVRNARVCMCVYANARYEKHMAYICTLNMQRSPVFISTLPTRMMLRLFHIHVSISWDTADYKM